MERGASVVVLSLGQHERLQVMSETREWLERRDIECIVLPTPEAVDRHNELRSVEAVGGLFHSTC